MLGEQGTAGVVSQKGALAETENGTFILALNRLV